MRISFVLQTYTFLWTGPTMVDVLGLGYSLVDDVCTLVADKPAKRFKCEYCPKAFAESGSLTMHERMHTGETHAPQAAASRKVCDWPGCGARGGSGGMHAGMLNPISAIRMQTASLAAASSPTARPPV